MLWYDARNLSITRSRVGSLLTWSPSSVIHPSSCYSSCVGSLWHSIILGVFRMFHSRVIHIQVLANFTVLIRMTRQGEGVGETPL